MLAGAGQFGTPDQGIFAYWINAHLRRRPLRYIGFDGSGKQVRDAVPSARSGGPAARADRTSSAEVASGSIRLAAACRRSCPWRDLTAWCDVRFGASLPRGGRYGAAPYDIPWIAMDYRGGDARFRMAAGARGIDGFSKRSRPTPKRIPTGWSGVAHEIAGAAAGTGRCGCSRS